jgi:hypothetical protein
MTDRSAIFYLGEERLDGAKTPRDYFQDKGKCAEKVIFVPDGKEGNISVVQSSANQQKIFLCFQNEQTKQVIRIVAFKTSMMGGYLFWVAKGARES